jgi:predicted site-specific integrase-resolvase
MDQIDINDMIFDLNRLWDKLGYAKRDTQRHLQGCADPDNLQARVDRLEETMTDVAWEIDSVRERLDKLVDMLEEKKFKMDMDRLSKRLYKWEDFRGV